MNGLSNRRAPLGGRGQRGVVLFIALIVLVAMSLAGIAIMRSVDTGNLISGNVAFKQATLSAADRGVDVAFQYLKDNVQLPTLETDQPSEGFYAAASDPPNNDWSDPSVWGDAKVVGTDSAGNTISYLIHRMCDLPGKYTTVNCAQTPRTGPKDNNSRSVGGAQFATTPVVYYRVTVRVQGPRDTLSVVQSNIGLQH